MRACRLSILISPTYIVLHFPTWIEMSGKLGRVKGQKKGCVSGKEKTWNLRYIWRIVCWMLLTGKIDMKLNQYEQITSRMLTLVFLQDVQMAFLYFPKQGGWGLGMTNMCWWLIDWLIKQTLNTHTHWLRRQMWYELYIGANI